MTQQKTDLCERDPHAAERLPVGRGGHEDQRRLLLILKMRLRGGDAVAVVAVPVVKVPACGPRAGSAPGIARAADLILWQRDSCVHFLWLVFVARPALNSDFL